MTAGSPTIAKRFASERPAAPFLGVEEPPGVPLPGVGFCWFPLQVSLPLMVPLFLNVVNGPQSKSFAEVCMLKFPRTSDRSGRETLGHTSVLLEMKKKDG